jgi:hypothetical protein
MTRKHRKTADWTVGEVGIVLRLSANRSEIQRKKSKIIQMIIINKTKIDS